MINLQEVVSAVNSAPSGSFIGITDYISEKGDVSSVTGQIGVGYSNAKEKALEAMEKAIAEKDFEPITVEGICNWDTEKKEWNSRKKSMPVKTFKVTFNKAQVIAVATEVMESYRDAIKKSNKVQLSNKENGVYLESNTDNINVTVLVANQTYKELESMAVKANKGITDKPKSSMPEAMLKAQIRKRFEPKFKSFTLRSDNFAKLSIGGNTFE